MSEVKVEIIGGDRIKSKLLRVEGGMDPVVRAALDAVANQIKDDARAFCPVDTGSLRESIRKEAVARPAQKAWEVGVRAGGYVTNPKTNRIVDYAVHVEFGTSRARAQPFLRPAMLGNQSNVRKAIQEGLKESLQGGD